MIHIMHIAIWVSDLESQKRFFETYFGGKAGNKYENSRKGFQSYFLSFGTGVRLELMHKEGVSFARFADENERASEEPVSGIHDPERYVAPDHVGFAHLAFSVGSEAEVDRLTSKLESCGVPVLSVPRRTGDGYYESVIADPEGNIIEITS